MRRFLITLLCLVPWLAQAQLESTSDLNRGLVGWWKFDTGTGTNAFDLSGNANTGALSGSTLPVWTNGVFGGALSFDGTNAFVAISSVSTGTNGSISCWFWPNSQVTDYGPILCDSDSLKGLYYRKTVNFITLYYSTDHYANFHPTNNVWIHVAVTYSNGNVAFYINGAAEGTGSGFPGFSASRIGLAVGDRLRGNLDDLRIYSRALSATEVLNLYCQGGGRTP